MCVQLFFCFCMYCRGVCWNAIYFFGYAISATLFRLHDSLFGGYNLLCMFVFYNQKTNIYFALFLILFSNFFCKCCCCCCCFNLHTVHVFSRCCLLHTILCSLLLFSSVQIVSIQTKITRVFICLWTELLFFFHPAVEMTLCSCIVVRFCCFSSRCSLST